MNSMTATSQKQGNIVNLRFESNVLSDNPLGDPHERDLFVYLPPGYDEGGDNYPTVYCLTGFTGRGKMLLNDNAFSPNLAQRMDRLVSAGVIRPMIVVMPDCFTRYGGSQYINSSATGNYEDYLTKEIVLRVDSELRTIAECGSRAVMGKSSGGYGALIMGMRHSDTFGLVASISGDAYFEYCYPGDFPAAFREINGDPLGYIERLWSNEKKPKGFHSALNVIGMSACYSPIGADFDLPFDLSCGELRQDVWQRWLEHDPVRLVEKHVENLLALRLLYIDAGKRDEFYLDIGARILSKKLDEHAVEHMREEFDDGHFNISYRYDRALELISAKIGGA